MYVKYRPFTKSSHVLQLVVVLAVVMMPRAV